VYAAQGSDVTTVIVNGKIVVRDRQLLTFDLEETMHRVRKLAEALS
jgi:5-methylthioadenosine/S-adenosylhomocysteine deaminase